MRPVILITTDRRDGGPGPTHPRIRPKRAEAYVTEAVIERVRAEGGVPLLVPPGEGDVQRLLEVADGVVLTGGHFDIHPRHYGQQTKGRLDRVEEDRTVMELAIAAECLKNRVPVLGICGGHQALAVAAGGTLVQDIGSEMVGALEHEQHADPAESSHEVVLDDRVAPIWGTSTISVNSTHHQAVLDPGSLRVVGRSSDGVVEVIYGVGVGFVLGVQWHPELLGEAAPFRALLNACKVG